MAPTSLALPSWLPRRFGVYFRKVHSSTCVLHIDFFFLVSFYEMHAPYGPGDAHFRFFVTAVLGVFALVFCLRLGAHSILPNQGRCARCRLFFRLLNSFQVETMSIDHIYKTCGRVSVGRMFTPLLPSLPAAARAHTHAYAHTYQASCGPGCTRLSCASTMTTTPRKARNSRAKAASEDSRRRKVVV